MTTIELLDETYKNLRMATWAIDTLMGNIKNEDLKRLVTEQNEIYLRYTEDCENLAKEQNYELYELSAMLKTMSWISIKLKTLLNKETSHIAEKLIQGNNMGIITLTRALNHAEDPSSDEYNLASALKNEEEKFVNSLKEYL